MRFVKKLMQHITKHPKHQLAIVRCEISQHRTSIGAAGTSGLEGDFSHLLGNPAPGERETNPTSFALKGQFTPNQTTQR